MRESSPVYFFPLFFCCQRKMPDQMSRVDWVQSQLRCMCARDAQSRLDRFFFVSFTQSDMIAFNFTFMSNSNKSFISVTAAMKLWLLVSCNSIWCLCWFRFFRGGLCGRPATYNQPFFIWIHIPVSWRMQKDLTITTKFIRMMISPGFKLKMNAFAYQRVSVFGIVNVPSQ